MPIQSVSKLDAATRQLHMAILLYFQDADALGVHTLAGAAHGILKDLARKHGHESVQSTGAGVQSHQLAFVMSMINKAKRFLKHVDSDPEDVSTFNPDWTDFLLFDAIQMHLRLTTTLDHADIIFLVWLSSKYPGVLHLDTTILGANASEFRRIFPTLGAIGEKKRIFLAALNDKSPHLPYSR